MRKRICLPIALAVISMAAEDPQGDVSKIQGAWDVSRIEMNGKVNRPALGLKIRVKFDGDRLLAGPRNLQPELKGTIKLDPSREPKAYDLTPPDKGKVILGIYALDGDTLKVCLSSPDDERPTDFTTAPEDGRTLIIYQRVKPSPVE